MSITRCVDLSAARWIEERQEDWHRLAARGPVCFDKYARLRFIPDPSYPGQREGEVRADPGALSDNEQLGVVLAELARHTDTPDDCYFLVWNGWPSFRADDPTPRLSIPNRDYFLFHAALTDFTDWDPQVMALLDDIEAPTPAFVWPADRAWCVTCDVDPHFASIGADSDAIDAVVAHPRVDVVVDEPDTEPPYYQ
ncbi:hypothetical protein ACGFIU_08945 [Rhodococcus oryzae]|uniref:hypothetical protein n=1 Tax=Rhodococcus oryzae TaxID=2571143 RepID=UPI003713F949